MSDPRDPYAPPSVRPGVTPPSSRVVDSLEEAGPGTLVHIDGKGRVMTRRSYRWRLGLVYVLNALLLAGLAVVLWWFMGTLGATSVALASAFLLWEWWRRRRLLTATKLLAAERYDDAEELLRPMALRGRRRDRALANALLAMTSARRGEAGAALERARTAQALARGLAGLGLGMHRRSWRYLEIRALAVLGRCDEASALLAKAPPEAPGSLLELSAWSAALRIDFERGRTELAPDEVTRRVGRVEKLAFEELAALTSWALAQQGREAEARALAAKVAARPDARRIETTDPKLWQWLQQARAPDPA